MTLLARFDAWMLDEKGWSRQTRVVRKGTVRAFERFLRKQRGHGLLQADRADVIAYLKLARHPRSRNKYLGDIRAFYRFALQFRYRTVSPASDIPRVPVPRLLPKPLAKEQALRLMAAADALGARHGMIVALLLYTGLRREEAVALTVANLDFDKREIHLQGKGMRERSVPIHDALAPRLRAWIASTGSAFLFPGYRLEDDHLSPIQLWDDVKTAAEVAGLQPPGMGASRAGGVTPHRLRHTYATELLSAGSDIRRVQVLLGHASLTSTQIYTEVLNSHLHEDVARLDFTQRPQQREAP